MLGLLYLALQKLLQVDKNSQHHNTYDNSTEWPSQSQNWTQALNVEDLNVTKNTIKQTNWEPNNDARMSSYFMF